MGIKHIPEQLVSQRRNQNRNQEVSWENQNGNTTYQNAWDAGKAVIRGKFVVINTYVKEK